MGASGANEIVFTDRAALREVTIAMPAMEWSIFMVGRYKLAHVGRGPLRGCLASGQLPLSIRELAREAGITRPSDAKKAVESLIARGLFEWFDHQGRTFLRVVGFGNEQDRCLKRIRAKIRARMPKRMALSASDEGLQGVTDENIGKGPGRAVVDKSSIFVDNSSNPVDKGPFPGAEADVDNSSNCAQQTPLSNEGDHIHQRLKGSKPGQVAITPDRNVNVNVLTTTSGGAHPGGASCPGPASAPAPASRSGGYNGTARAAELRAAIARIVDPEKRNDCHSLLTEWEAGRLSDSRDALAGLVNVVLEKQRNGTAEDSDCSRSFDGAAPGPGTDAPPGWAPPDEAKLSEIVATIEDVTEDRHSTRKFLKQLRTLTATREGYALAQDCVTRLKKRIRSVDPQDHIRKRGAWLNYEFQRAINSLETKSTAVSQAAS